MQSTGSEMYAVTARRGIVTAIYLAGTLVLLMIILQIAVRPLRDLYGPIVWWSQYEQTPAMRVIQELEAEGIIPLGTTWAEEHLAGRRTTLRLLLASPNDALAELARSDDFTIRYKVGYHGDIIAAPRIRAAPTRRGAAIPEIDVRLERDIVSRSAAPN